MDEAKGPVVWIVDDVATVRESTRALLETYGMTVRDYASARGYLADFDSNSTAKGCLILDLHMPEMSGLELLETLRARGAMFPIIVFTGRGDDALKEQVIGAGAVAMLHKPVDDKELVSLIEQAMRDPG